MLIFRKDVQRPVTSSQLQRLKIHHFIICIDFTAFNLFTSQFVILITLCHMALCDCEIHKSTKGSKTNTIHVQLKLPWL